MNKILAIVAHPDDEVLGCGGTIARLNQEGHQVYTLVLGEGITSRQTGPTDHNLNSQLTELQSDLQRANALLGVKQVFSFKFPDNRFDTVPLLEIVQCIERIKTDLAPQIVLTHFADDLNVDHRITCQAVLTATRPVPGETVQEVYAFEVGSCTEWSFPLLFSPDTFVDIGSTLDLKREALRQYRSEIREYPHPRSIEGLTTAARLRGIQVGREYCEAFETLRRII